MNEKDHIKELFQSKLSNFEAKVPTDGWEKLETALYAPAKKRIIPVYWYAAAAVAIILIVGGIFVFRSPDLSQPNNVSQKQPVHIEKSKSETDLPQRIQTQPQTNDKLLTESSTQSTYDKNNARTRVSRTVRKKVTVPHSALLSEHISMNTEQTEIAIDTEVDIDDDATLLDKQYELIRARELAESNEAKAAEMTDELIDHNQHSGLYGGESFSDWDDREISLAMNSNSSMMSYTQSGTQRISLRSSSLEDEAKSFSANSERAQSAIKNDYVPSKARLAHNQPISLGLMLSRKMSDRVAIEAGLMYTHLISKSLNDSRNSDKQERQSIHYIGIPVNVNYKFASWNNLDLYLSLGGAVQKDVYGRFSYQEQIVNPENESASLETVSLKINQKNPQFSVNGGLGIAYPIYNDLKLYGKFGAAYYLDAKNEYKTIYSDQKLQFDANIGLRIDF